MDQNSERSTKKKKMKAPRVTADFGGRRKIFERRLRRATIRHTERRNGNDRRSGFDRRSAQNQDDCEDSLKRNVTRN